MFDRSGWISRSRRRASPKDSRTLVRAAPLDDLCLDHMARSFGTTGVRLDFDLNANSQRALQCRCLITLPRLNLDEDIDQRHCCGCYAGNPRRLSERLRNYFSQLFLHLARQAADRAVVEPIRDATLFGLLQ